MSTPDTVWPISASANAIALIPGPPAPITCTRRGCERSSGATGTLAVERAGAARSGVDAAITTRPGYGRTRGDVCDGLGSTRSRHRLDQLGERAAAVERPEL
jgi:hypothetical protein